MDFTSHQPDTVAGKLMQLCSSELHKGEDKLRFIAKLACNALICEAKLTPKPGLVDQQNNGSHKDLNLPLMLASARSLEPHFVLIGRAARAQPTTLRLREKLGKLGREAELTMLSKTRGINTHRGAIWSLGLLCSAAMQNSQDLKAQALCQRASHIAQLKDCYAPFEFSKGKQVCNRYHVKGAKEQAQLGFPQIIEQALPRLRYSRTQGASETEARLDALLAIMTTLSDTCVLSRSGPKGLLQLQKTSQEILNLGGAASTAGYQKLQRLDQQMITINASPGGAADLLAATLFLDWLERLEL